MHKSHSQLRYSYHAVIAYWGCVYRKVLEILYDLFYLDKYEASIN